MQRNPLSLKIINFKLREGSFQALLDTKICVQTPGCCTIVQCCPCCAALCHPLYLVLPRITICITISDDNADHGTAVTRHPHVYHVYPAHVCMLMWCCHCICIIPNVNVSVSSYKSSLSDKPHTSCLHTAQCCSNGTIHTFAFDTRT